MQGIENIQTCKSQISSANYHKTHFGLLYCQGKTEKYTAYSELTGVTKSEGQSILKEIRCSNPNNLSNFAKHVPELTSIVCECAYERDWHKMNRPRSLVLAIIGEAGELADVFRFIPDCKQELSQTEIDKASQEVAHVTIFLLQLAKECGISLV